MSVTVNKVAAVADASSGALAPEVTFTLTDKNGYPVDINGGYSNNQPMSVAVGLASYSVSNGIATPLTPLTGTPATSDPGTNPIPAVGTTTDVGGGTLTSPANGVYVYTFNQVFDATNWQQTVTAWPTDPTLTYVVWIQAQRQEDLVNADNMKTNTTVNTQYNFTVPAGPVVGSVGTAVSTQRKLVSTNGCNKCHDGFTRDTVSQVFHGASVNDSALCNFCHNPVRTDINANSNTYIHRIHNSEHLQNTQQTTGNYRPGRGQPYVNCTVASPCPAPATNLFRGIEFPYVQDIRNCTVCHDSSDPTVQQPTQWLNHPTTQGCTSCHDYVDFSGASGLPYCTDPVTLNTSTGLPVLCAHLGGPQTDAACSTCHGSGKFVDTVKVHVAVQPPDPTNCLVQNNASGCNSYTNAGYLPAAGAVVPNATPITYTVNAVGLTPAGNPYITFGFLKNGVAVPMDNCPEAASTPATGSGEIFNNFVGSPSVQFAFSVPQDGIQAPADFNGSTSAYIKAVCLTGKTAYSGAAVSATITQAPNYLYTITIIGTANLGPTGANVKMLTGGVGYTYGLSSTQPLTETDLTAYPATQTNVTAGKVNNVTCSVATPCVVTTGGLVNVAPNVWVVGKGFTGRRTIVDNGKCKNCHAALGAAPTFHAGNRNDGQTCTFCHNQNGNNNGWSYNAKDFIHALHAGVVVGTLLPDGTTSTSADGIRTVAFTYQAKSASDGFWNVEFPGPHSYCEACHVPGGYDFSQSAAQAALPNLLWSTTASDGMPTAGTNLSPYVSTTTTYGSGFSFDAIAGTTTNPAGTTLVTSPITAACVACHDSAADRAHMTGNGGSFYVARSVATAVEQCLICHGPTSLAPISSVHQ